MLRTRVIPSLLLKNRGLVKTIRFDKAKYVGDPINAIRIFNEKEVDELVVLDIEATKRGSIDFDLLAQLNKEAFMPLGYGGGIKKVDDVQRILQLGYEKVIIDSAAINDPALIARCSKACGSQSVVCCIDVKRDLFGNYYVYDYRNAKASKLRAIDWAQQCVTNGAGELLVYSVDNDGAYTGFDIKFLKSITSSVSVPVVALGGARNYEDFCIAVSEGGASAVAAGSLFVFYGPHKAVLITYPARAVLEKIFK
jgi:cyclase